MSYKHFQLTVLQSRAPLLHSVKVKTGPTQSSSYSPHCVVCTSGGKFLSKPGGTAQPIGEHQVQNNSVPQCSKSSQNEVMRIDHVRSCTNRCIYHIDYQAVLSSTTLLTNINVLEQFHIFYIMNGFNPLLFSELFPSLACRQAGFHHCIHTPHWCKPCQAVNHRHPARHQANNQHPTSPPSVSNATNVPIITVPQTTSMRCTRVYVC